MLLMMFVACWLMTALIIRRTGMLSPASISAAFTSFSLSPFFFSYYIGIEYDNMTKNPLFKDIWQYEDIIHLVVAAHLILVAATLLSILGVKKPEIAGGAGGTGVTDMIVRIIPGRAEVATRTPWWVTYALLWLVALEFGHFLSIDKSLLWENSDYMLLNYSDRIGIRYPIFDMVHQILGPLSALTVCLSYYFWQKRKILPLALSMIAFGYSALFKLAMFSRWSALTAVIFTGLLAAKRISRGKSVISWATVTMGFVTIWLFLFAITARSGETQGLAGILPNLFNWDYAASDLSHLLVNICLGPYVLAEAIQSGPYVYDSKYMFLSFSILPSILDGWRTVFDQYHRINWYTPFNGFAELYYFGWPYQVFYGVVYMICIRVLTKAMAQMGTSLGMLIVSPSLFSFFTFHQYIVRFGFRLMIYTALFSWIVTRVTTANQRRVRPVFNGRTRDRTVGGMRDIEEFIARRAPSRRVAADPRLSSRS
jgi:hypothetical protein